MEKMSLFTMNLGRKPFEEIPKKEIKFSLTNEEKKEEILFKMETEELTKVLKEKLSLETSYYDDTLENATPRHNLKCALWIACDNLLKNNDDF